MGKIVATSGYFNPLHIGHVRLIQAARRLGDRLVVIVNNDAQVKLKGSVPFMDEAERVEIVRAIAGVDEVVLSIDKDKTVRETLKLVRPDIFAKGGDSVIQLVPESHTCRDMGTKIRYGVGGEKVQSSSSLIKKTWNRT